MCSCIAVICKKKNHPCLRISKWAGKKCLQKLLPTLAISKSLAAGSPLEIILVIFQSSLFWNSVKIRMEHEVFFTDSHQLSNWRLLLHTSDHHFSHCQNASSSSCCLIVFTRVSHLPFLFPCFQWPHPGFWVEKNKFNSCFRTLGLVLKRCVWKVQN